MTTPNKPKPTAKELLTGFVAECGFQLTLTLVIGMLGTLVGFVIWTSFWALFLLLPLFAVLYHLIKKQQNQS
ncbi:MAG: hypothetical protein Q4A69_08955 [Moraxella sp.]|nr:hypothetical protein [Moraxella sp.]